MALNQAIRAVIFQSITSETVAVTAEAAGSGPSVLSYFFHKTLASYSAGLSYFVFQIRTHLWGGA